MANNVEHAAFFDAGRFILAGKAHGHEYADLLALFHHQPVRRLIGGLFKLGMKFRGRGSVEDRQQEGVDRSVVSRPGRNKTLLTLFGAEHMFGGVSGYDAGVTSEENPERVAAVRALIWAYLRSALDPGDPA